MSPHEFVIVHLAKGEHPDLSLVTDSSASRTSVVVDLAKYFYWSEERLSGCGGRWELPKEPSNFNFSGNRLCSPRLPGEVEKTFNELQVCRVFVTG
jgi:hypothetical protein